MKSIRLTHWLTTEATGRQGQNLAAGEDFKCPVDFHGPLIPTIDTDITGSTKFLQSTMRVTVEVK